MTFIENPPTSTSGSVLIDKEPSHEVLNDYQTFLAVMDALEVLEFPQLPLEKQRELKYGYTEPSGPQRVWSDYLEREVEFPRKWYNIWDEASKKRLIERLNPMKGITREGLVLVISGRDVLYSPTELLTLWGRLDGFVRGQATTEQWIAAVPHILESLAAERLRTTDTGTLYAIRRVGEISLPQPVILELDKPNLIGAIERREAWSQLVETFAGEKKKEFYDIYHNSK